MLLLVDHTLAANAQQSTPAVPANSAPRARVFRPGDPATRAGFDHFYSLEYDAFIVDFEQAISSHPDDPFARQPSALGRVVQGALSCRCARWRPRHRLRKLLLDQQALCRFFLTHDAVSGMFTIYSPMVRLIMRRVSKGIHFLSC